jgi:hypothetical protein
MAVGDFETEGMDQVEPRARQGAHPAHVSGILGNLGLKENDVDHWPAFIGGAA